MTTWKTSSLRRFATLQISGEAARFRRSLRTLISLVRRTGHHVLRKKLSFTSQLKRKLKENSYRDRRKAIILPYFLET